MWDRLLSIIPEHYRKFVVALGLAFALGGMGWSVMADLHAAEKSAAGAMEDAAKARDAMFRIDTRLSVVEKTISTSGDDQKAIRDDIRDIRNILLQEARRQRQ